MARKSTKSATVKAATKAAEAKTVEVKAETTPVVEAKEEVKEVVEVKAEEKAEEKKAPAKKAAATTKKTTAKVDEKVVLQLGFAEYTTEDIVDMCKKAYEAENKTKIKNIDVYVKPEDRKAYYVVNEKVAGAVEL